MLIVITITVITIYIKHKKIQNICLYGCIDSKAKPRMIGEKAANQLKWICQSLLLS